MNLGSKLSDFWRRFQGELFHALAEEVGPLLGTHRRFVAALDLVGVEGFLGEKGYGPGRPPEVRRAVVPLPARMPDRIGGNKVIQRSATKAQGASDD